MFFLFLSVFIWHSAVLVERRFSRGNESSLCYDHKAHDEPYVILTFKLCFTYFKRSLVWFLSLTDLSLYAFWLSLCVCTCETSLSFPQEPLKALWWNRSLAPSHLAHVIKLGLWQGWGDLRERSFHVCQAVVSIIRSNHFDPNILKTPNQVATEAKIESLEAKLCINVYHLT